MRSHGPGQKSRVVLHRRGWFGGSAGGGGRCRGSCFCRLRRGWKCCGCFIEQRRTCACPVPHSSLPRPLCDSAERVQRAAFLDPHGFRGKRRHPHHLTVESLTRKMKPPCVCRLLFPACFIALNLSCRGSSTRCSTSSTPARRSCRRRRRPLTPTPFWRRLSWNTRRRAWRGWSRGRTTPTRMVSGKTQFRVRCGQGLLALGLFFFGVEVYDDAKGRGLRALFEIESCMHVVGVIFAVRSLQ